jgi:hypothetical protein
MCGLHGIAVQLASREKPMVVAEDAADRAAVRLRKSVRIARVDGGQLTR